MAGLRLGHKEGAFADKGQSYQIIRSGERVQKSRCIKGFPRQKRAPGEPQAAFWARVDREKGSGGSEENGSMEAGSAGKNALSVCAASTGLALPDVRKQDVGKNPNFVRDRLWRGEKRKVKPPPKKK